MASESAELEKQQVDGRKNEEPAWSVTKFTTCYHLVQRQPSVLQYKS